MSTGDKEIVSALRIALTERIGQERFELWFGGQARLEVRAHTLHVVAPDRFLLERLRNSFRADLEAVCRRWLGPAAAVEFQFEERSGEASGSADPPRVQRAGGVRAGGVRAGVVRAGGERPDSRTAPGAQRPASSGRSLATLDGFVVGDSNRIAFAGVRAVAEQPGRITPLFVYGASGTGKTHLLEGISAAARRQRGLRRVVMLSAEQFTTSFLEALRGSGLPNFRRKYRDVEVLLIDDLQFFNGKSATIVELLHTVDSLLRQGRQLVLSANRSPAELNGLGGELIGRISGGLVCGLEPPDEATRLGIARALAAAGRREVPDQVLAVIAARVTGDARLVGGALNRLVAASEALNQPIDLPLAEYALADVFRMTRRVVQLSDIQSAVCEVFGIDAKSLHSGRKSKTLSQPRMLAMWLARKYTRAAFAEIGEYFGRRSHSTVISAHKKVELWMAGGEKLQLGPGDCDVRDAIRRVESRLGAG